MWAVLLAGGQGTRLRSVISEVPKPLAPIRGRPFLAYLLDHLARGGITNAVLAVGYLGEQIIQCFGERYGDLSIHYSVEREPLGTGGALRQALDLIPSFPAFAFNGDTYADIDAKGMLRAHRAAQSKLTMAVRHIPNAHRYGRVIVNDGHIVAFEPAGLPGAGFINSGAYLFQENLLADPTGPEKFSFEKDFLEQRVAQLAPLAYETSGYFLDIGVPEDYQRAQTELF